MRVLLRTITALLAAALLAAVWLCVGCAPEPESSAEKEAVEAEVTETAEETESEDTAADEDVALMKEACGECHSVMRLYLQADTTDWDTVIASMNTAHGATLTPEQSQTIAEFLKEREASAGEAVVKAKCNTCHVASKIEAKPADTDWAKVIETMSKTHKAALTEEEQELALEFLQAQD